jgi:hypothetical protein
MFLESKFQPNQTQEIFLNHLLSANFPWFWNATIMRRDDGTNSKYTALTHTFRSRLREDKLDWGTPNSEYLSVAESIFWDACLQSNVIPKIIHRSAANLNLPNKDKHTDIHIDHSFPHKNFILYLNDFTNAPTYVFSDDHKTIINESIPEKNKFVIFSGLPHAAGFCKENERRIVLVVTFN